MKRRARRELFEVFRRPPETKRSVLGHRPGSPSVREPEPDRNGESAPRREGLPASLPLSIEVVVVAAAVFVGVAIAGYALGYFRGRSRRPVVAGRSETPTAVRAEAGPGARDAARVPARQPPARALNIGADAGAQSGPSVPAPFYTLRIISGIDLQNARNIAKDLRAKGYYVMIIKSGAHHGYTVNVGRHASRRGATQKALKETFAKMSYRGNQWFESCFWIQIKHTRSIVR